MRHIGKSFYIRELKKRSKSLGNGLYEFNGIRFLDASEALKPHELRGMALTHMVHDEWLINPKPHISLRKIRRQRKVIRLRHAYKKFAAPIFNMLTPPERRWWTISNKD